MPLIQATQKDGPIYRTIYDHLILIIPSTGMREAILAECDSCKKADVWGKGEGGERLERRYAKIIIFPSGESAHLRPVLVNKNQCEYLSPQLSKTDPLCSSP